jgi:hypothetical protein
MNPMQTTLSCANKIPYELIKHILEIGSSLMKHDIWYPTIDVMTGTIRYRFNKQSQHRGVIVLDHMLRFKKIHPPRFHDLTIGFYILDGVSYPCVEYILSKETSGRRFVIGEPYDETFSLTRKYIVISKEKETFDYVYMDTQYEMREGEFYSARRYGWLIRDDEENIDYESVNDATGYRRKYNQPWDMETHGKTTYKFDINVWNWEHSGGQIMDSDFNVFWEEPTVYDEDYACLSFSWKSENHFENGYNYDNGSFGKFAQYDQLEMDTIQIIW